MSMNISAAVWARSRQKGAAKLMLLAIADHADDDGTAYPGVPRLARLCGIQVRAANYLLAQLQRSGELQVALNAGPKGCNLYRIVVPTAPPTPLQSFAAPLQEIAPLQPLQEVAGPLQNFVATPARSCPEPLQELADEPSLNHQRTNTVVGAATTSPPPPQPAAPAVVLTLTPPPTRPAPKPPKAPKPSKESRSSRMPKEWTLPPEWAAWARHERPDLDVQRVASMFHDHWLSAPGQRGVKADWLATWRNWVRAETRGSMTKPGAAPAVESFRDRAARERAQRIAPSVAVKAPTQRQGTIDLGATEIIDDRHTTPAARVG